VYDKGDIVSNITLVMMGGVKIGMAEIDRLFN